MAEGENKGQRLLGIYHRLSRGELISKEVLAREYGVTEKSIQRDIDDIRSYLAGDRDKGAADICYDRQAKGYRLVEEESRCLTRKEILAMAKILLESRAFAKEELHTILDKLIEACPREGRKVVEDMIRNETFCYVPPRHGKKLLDALWDISLFIKNREIIRFPTSGRTGQKKSTPPSRWPSFSPNSISTWWPTKKRKRNFPPFPGGPYKNHGKDREPFPGALPRPVQGRRIPETGAVHVPRRPAPGHIHLQRSLRGSSARPPSHRPHPIP